MGLDQSIVGRAFPPTPPYAVSEAKVREFADAVGADYSGGAAPATFVTVLAIRAMNTFLDTMGLDLSRIVHGDQKFSYQRPVRPGDVLTATLAVASLRQIGGNDIIGTRSEVTDADGALVCTSAATLVHRSEP